MLYVSDVGAYADHLATLAPRDEIGRGYFKVHGSLHCVCFTPWQFRELRRQIDLKLHECVAKEQLENLRMNEAMDAITRSPHVQEDARLPVRIECET